MKSVLLLLGAVWLTWSAATPAYARGCGGPSDWFPEIDVGGTGRNAFRAYLDRQLNRFDTMVGDKTANLPATGFLRLAVFAPTLEASGFAAPEERDSFYRDRFGKIDTDADGKVSRAEFERYVISIFEAWLTCRRFNPSARTPDQNGDGLVTLQELIAFYVDGLLGSDSNEDSRISLDERLDRAGEPNDRRQPPYEQRVEKLTQCFRELDTDNDGFVTITEIEAMATARFKRMDADHDGSVTPQEWQAEIGRPSASCY